MRAWKKGLMPSLGTYFLLLFSLENVINKKGEKETHGIEIWEYQGRVLRSRDHTAIYKKLAKYELLLSIKSCVNWVSSDVSVVPLLKAFLVLIESWNTTDSIFYT